MSDEPAKVALALLVTGSAGSGKTTYLAGLLAQRPQGARWAVLLNDFGVAALPAAPDVSVREVAGCICCSAQVSLRTAVVSLLREKPGRLLIEASAAAHPRAILGVLRKPGIASSVEIERTVCLVDPAQAVDPRYTALDLYREQVTAADVVVLTKGDLRSDDVRGAAREALTRIGARRVE